MKELPAEILAYYERGEEADRLTGHSPSGALELARTREIVLRHLPPPPLEVLDVGGAAGIHAAWLTERGDSVHLVDPVPLHVAQAREAVAGMTAEVGDARELTKASDSVDVVLLLGPLYHLLERDERLRALSEARRVLRAGGLLFAAAISRFAALLDVVLRVDRLHEPEVLAAVFASVETGVFAGDAFGFTTAYFHRPLELTAEVAEAGFADVPVLNVEGPGFLAGDLRERWQDPSRREAILSAARLIEAEPEALGAASHLMAVGRRP